MEVGTEKTGETGADTVLDRAWGVWDGFGIRQGNIADREGRERGWSGRQASYYSSDVKIPQWSTDERENNLALGTDLFLTLKTEILN